jgi:hypothetical protein
VSERSGATAASGDGLATPVALVVFNRPEPTARVFERVRAARPATLLVIADGPRAGHPEDAARCARVREIVTRVDWPCELLTNFSEANLGCKRRVSTGLDWVFATVGEAIVLEDDCVPHPTFFGFCEAMLARYRDDERVAMIGGTNYLHRTPGPASYLFSRYFAIWGWATWSRAWQHYDLAMADWPARRGDGTVAYAYPQPYMRRHVTAMFDAAHAGALDTWDVQWFYACLVNSGLCVVPHVNQIANIGYVGTHTSPEDASHPAFDMPTFDLDVDALVHPPHVAPDWTYDDTFFERRIRAGRPTRLARLAAALSRRARSARVLPAAGADHATPTPPNPLSHEPSYE